MTTKLFHLAFLLLLASFSAAEQCSGYADLDARINRGREDCKEIRDSIVEAESGCALRSMLNGTDAYFVCIFGQDYFLWLDENNNGFDFTVLKEELARVQEADELNHVADEVEEQSVPIPEDELEIFTASVLATGAEIEGEQDACWYDGEAGREARFVADFFVLFRAIGANTPDYCQNFEFF